MSTVEREVRNEMRTATKIRVRVLGRVVSRVPQYVGGRILVRDGGTRHEVTDFTVKTFEGSPVRLVTFET